MYLTLLPEGAWKDVELGLNNTKYRIKSNESNYLSAMAKYYPHYLDDISILISIDEITSQ